MPRNAAAQELAALLDNIHSLATTALDSSHDDTQEQLKLIRRILRVVANAKESLRRLVA